MMRDFADVSNFANEETKRGGAPLSRDKKTQPLLFSSLNSAQPKTDDEAPAELPGL